MFMKKATLLVAALLCCLTLTCCGDAHVGNMLGESFTYDGADGYSIGGATVTESVRRIEIQWLAGAVELIAGDGDGVVFEESADRILNDDLVMRWQMEDGTLRLKFCNSGRWTMDGLTKTLTLKLPQDTKLESVEITTISADVRAQEISAGKINWNTTSGDITAQLNDARELCLLTVSGILDVTGAADAETVDVHSTSGGIFLNLGKVDRLNVVTVSGGIHAALVQGTAMDFSSTSGGIVLRLEEGGDCKIRTVSGGVMLATADDLGFAVDYDTVSGRMDSEIPLRMEDGWSVFGDGAQRFDVDTTSGNLSILAE